MRYSAPLANAASASTLRLDATPWKSGLHTGGLSRFLSCPTLCAMTAAVFETHMLPNPRGRRRDVQLFADVFADAVQRALAAAANLLVCGQIVFDALARQVCRQGLASALLRRRWRNLWQAGIGQRHGTILRRGFICSASLNTRSLRFSLLGA